MDYYSSILFVEQVLRRNSFVCPTAVTVCRYAMSAMNNGLAPASSERIMKMLCVIMTYYHNNPQSTSYEWCFRHDRAVILLLCDGLHFTTDSSRVANEAALAELAQHLQWNHEINYMALRTEISAMYSAELEQRTVDICKNAGSYKEPGHLYRLCVIIRHLYFHHDAESDRGFVHETLATIAQKLASRRSSSPRMNSSSLTCTQILITILERYNGRVSLDALTSQSLVGPISRYRLLHLQSHQRWTDNRAVCDLIMHALHFTVSYLPVIPYSQAPCVSSSHMLRDDCYQQFPQTA